MIALLYSRVTCPGTRQTLLQAKQSLDRTEITPGGIAASDSPGWEVVCGKEARHGCKKKKKKKKKRGVSVDVIRSPGGQSHCVCVCVYVLSRLHASQQVKCEGAAHNGSSTSVTWWKLRWLGDMRKAPDLKLPVASCALAHIHSHTHTHTHTRGIHPAAYVANSLVSRSFVSE